MLYFGRDWGGWERYIDQMEMEQMREIDYETQDTPFHCAYIFNLNN